MISVPAVSIIMPCFNGARTVEQAIRSAFAQTYQDWELVVVDDGSRDASPAILRQLAASDVRVRILTNATPSGASIARNRALSEARGRYVAFLDADDAWLPSKLELQLRAMVESNAALVCSSYDIMNADGSITGNVRPKPGPLKYRSMLADNPIGTLTVLVDRKLCGDVRFQQNLRTSEDYQLWLSIIRRGLTAICLPDVLAVYRVHGSSLSSNKVLAARNRWRVYREFEQLSWPTSVILLAQYAVSGALKTVRMRMGASSA